MDMKEQIEKMVSRIQKDDDLMERMARKEQLAKVAWAVDTVLTPQERQVITLRYGLGTGKPCRQREVAQQTGISRSYVSHHAYCKR